MADGKIIIETGLDLTGITRDLNSLRGSLGSINLSGLTNSFRQLTTTLNQTGTQLEEQRRRLQQLRTQLNASTDVNVGNALRTQMRETQTEITRLESEYNHLRDEVVNDLNSISDQHSRLNQNIQNNTQKVGENIKSVGKSISDVGSSLTTKLTLPIVGLGVAAAKVGMDFDSQMSRVKAISGATGEEFTKLHDQALQLGADTAFSAKEAAEGMENLASAGFSTNEIMEAMPGLLDLAASSGESLASSSDIAASTLRGFGLEASEAGHVADVLAKNASATNAAVADTGEAMKYIAPVAHSMGLGLEEVTAAIGEMANSGIKGSQAGTTLRSALTRLASPSNEAAGAMEAIGFNAFDSQGKLKSLSQVMGDYSKSLEGKTDQEKQDYTATIFGQEAMSGMLVLMEGGSSALDDLTDSYKSANGAASEMAKTMQDNSKSSVEQMMGSLETAAIKIEEALAPSIIQITGEIQDMANKFAELPEPIQETIIKTALFAAAAGPVLKVLGTATSGIGKLITFGGRLATTLGLVEEGTTLGGTALAAFSTAGIAAVGAASALVVGVAGAITYNELLNKSVTTSTDDLNTWEKAVNAVTGSTIKSKGELQKMGLIYKDFGKDVGEDFKKGIEDGRKAYRDFELAITGVGLEDTISDASSNKITSMVNNMVNAAKDAAAKHKNEMQDELSQMFTLDDGVVDENEQKVLDQVGSETDAKLTKINELQQDISDVWNKAIAEHGKLSQDDIEQIKHYVQQIQQIKAEIEAENDAESDFAKNQYGDQLSGMSADDARKLYTDASKELDEKFSKEKSVYKKGITDLTKEVKKAEDDGNQELVDNDKKLIEEKTQKYNDAINKEYSERRAYLDMLYKNNKNLEGNLNEVTGELFTSKDKNSQGDLYKLKEKFEQIKQVTKSGMISVQDSMGKWHDIDVTFDEATGNITSAYDRFTGDYGGYSKKFEETAKENGDAIKSELDKLASNVQYNLSNIKLDGNDIVNTNSGEKISELQTIITKADETKVAIATLNGEKVKIEFNKDGAITNADDIKSAVVDHLSSSPAKVDVDVNDTEALEKFKQLEDLKSKFDGVNLQETISIDGENLSTIDQVIDKLEKMPKDSKINLKINGDEVTTIDEAISKLKEIPEETKTDIKVENSEANEKLDETTKKADELDGKNSEVETSTNADETSSKVDNLADKVGNVPDHHQITFEAIGTGFATVAKQAAEIGAQGLKQLEGLDVSSHYTGTSGGTEGLTTANEHGWEISTGEEAVYLMGSGSGIMDHMSSVNEMNKEINSQVSNSVGKVVSTLVSAISVQSNLLSQVAGNTGEIVQNGNETIQLNKELATNLVNKWNSNSSNFSGLSSEINKANSDKDKADSMKVEDNYWYSSSKSQLDDVESQIKDIEDQIDNTTDEATKKQLQSQKKVLENQKDDLQDTVNYYKDAAQKEIDTCKETADQEVKIADEKKEKLTKIAEAVTTAIKNQLEQQKSAAETTINDQLSALETSYNSQNQEIEDSLKKKEDKIDEQIKALEEQSTEDSRDQERTEAQSNIFVLKTKMANTSDQADKRSIELQIEKAQKELDEKEESWSIEDQKSELEDEKTALETKAEKKKKALEEEYNTQKDSLEKQLKSVDEYYDKLLEEDSVNAQARYTLLNSNSQELVTLLNSYAPDWQNSGQSLADSLINGLNSQKQSVQDAVSEMVSLRWDSDSSDSDVTILQERKGYASGTNSNQYSGYYDVDENGFEIASSDNAVAYVSQGAAIKNHMASEQFIKSEIANQVAAMKSSVMDQQAQMQSLLLGNVARNTNNSKIVNNDNGVALHVENLNLNTGQDVEQLANELGTLSNRKKVD